MRYTHNRFCNNTDEFIFNGAGHWDIPIIQPEPYEPIDFVGFNYAKTISKQNTCKANGVHFFIDDYQFERVWNEWKKYGQFLNQFRAVFTPDFSLYTDWPKALQLFSHYKKHFIGAYLQRLGVKVYPTIGWSDESSYDWCFDGEPVKATVAVSSVGTQKNQQAKKAFLMGYDAMLEGLEPRVILFHGNVPKEARGNIIKIETFQEKQFRKLDKEVITS